MENIYTQSNWLYLFECTVFVYYQNYDSIT